MKKIINFATLFIIGAILLVSCEEEGIPTIDFGEGFLQLSAETGTLPEDSPDPLVTTVLLGNDGTNPNGVTVNFTVTSTDDTRFNVTPAGGTLQIPAGEFSADIVIEPINNIVSDGNLEITIELSDSSGLPLGIAGDGQVGTTRVVSFVDDDCPVDTDAFIGTFNVEEVFTSGTNEGLALANAFGENYQIELTAEPGDASGTKFIINNSAGFDTYLPNGTVLSLLTCTGTVTFSTGDTINVALFADMTNESSSYDEAQSTIQVDGPLGGFGPYQFVLRRQ